MDEVSNNNHLWTRTATLPDVYIKDIYNGQWIPDGSGGWSSRPYPSAQDLQLQIDSLILELNSQKKIIEKLCEHLLIEKAKNTEGINAVQVMKLLKSSIEGDREIAISLVNDKMLSEILLNE